MGQRVDVDRAVRWLHPVEAAYRRVLGGTDSPRTALDSVIPTVTRPERPAGGTRDPEDAHATRLRLPRLAALFAG